MTVDSTGDFPRVMVEPFLDPDAVREYRFTGFMEKFSKELEMATEPKSEAFLLKLVPGKNTAKIEALKSLVAEGYVALSIGARNAKLHTSIKPFRQLEDTGSDAA